MRRHSFNAPNDVFGKVDELLQSGQRLVLAAVLRAEGSTPRGTGARLIVTEDDDIYGTIGGGCVESFVYSEAKKIFQDGQLRIAECDLGDDSWSGLGMACGGKVELAMELVAPRPRIILLGGGHIAKSLTELGLMTGFDIIVCDPLAKVEDFPSSAHVHTLDYDEALNKVKPWPNDSIVIITGHHVDEVALRAALSWKVKYVGMIGSKNRVKVVFDSLIEKGLDPELVNAVHAPIGLDIKAETPAEIAVSIIAEIVMNIRGGSGGPKKSQTLNKTITRLVKRSSR
ncbi:MAG: hypothetical protein CMO12_02825 [Thaumarchaeota archaeon]|nr:hypothetical protein [Nitrososphaerota archaeon]|tara:strand:+ start:249 stop:1103 length:855 start_codon:yes stop_codon:yes gene_type:complete